MTEKRQKRYSKKSFQEDPLGRSFKHKSRNEMRNNLSKKTDKWRVCFHEAGHLVVAAKLFQWAVVSAWVSNRSPSGGWFGVCTIGKGAVLTWSVRAAVYAASGTESERYALTHGRRRRARKGPAEPAPDRGRDAAWRSESESHDIFKNVKDLVHDDVFISRCIAEIYPQYSEVKHWPRTHRRIRARARLILWENKGMLLRVASALHKKGFYLHAPDMDAGTGDNKTNQREGKVWSVKSESY